MIKPVSRKINELEKYFLYTKENIQFAVETSKPDLIPKVIRNIKNYNLGLHLKLMDNKFVWKNDPIHVHTLPTTIKNTRDACEFIDSIKYDYHDTFSVIAANDKTVAVSVSHMVCDGGFFRSIFSKLLDEDNSYQLKPHTPIVASDFFGSELSRVTNQDIENNHKLSSKITSLNWSNKYEELNNEKNKNLECNYYVDESPVEEFHFRRSKVNLTDLYNFSLALSIMSLNGRLHSNFGINTCVDLRQFVPKSKRHPLNTQNTSIVAVVAENVRPKMTVRDVITSLHQDLSKKLNDGTSFATLQCFLTNNFPPQKKFVQNPELSNVGRFFVSSEFARDVTDVWIQQKLASRFAEGGCFLLAFSREREGRNILATRLQQPQSVMSSEDAEVMLKSVVHLMKETPVDVTVQDAYDELRDFQKKYRNK